MVFVCLDSSWGGVASVNGCQSNFLLQVWVGVPLFTALLPVFSMHMSFGSVCDDELSGWGTEHNAGERSGVSWAEGCNSFGIMNPITHEAWLILEMVGGC